MKKIIDWFKQLDGREITLILFGFVIITLIILFMRENKLLLKERNYARQLVIEQSRSLVIIDSLEIVNVQVVKERETLVQQRKSLLKRYNELKAYNEKILARLKEITKVSHTTHRDARSLIQDLERHRRYVFISDELIDN